MDSNATHQPFRFAASPAHSSPSRDTAEATVEALAQQTRQEIRRIIGEITSLSRTRLPEHRYWPKFLSLVGTALAAEGGVLWQKAEGTWVSRHHVGDVDHRLFTPQHEGKGHRSHTGAPGHLAMLCEVGDSGGPVMVPPGAAWEDLEPGNPSSHLAAVVPVPLDQDAPVELMIELFIPAGSGPATQRGFLRFIAQMADLAADYVRTTRLRRAGDALELAAAADRLLVRLGQITLSHHWQQTLVDGLRHWAGAERVSLVDVSHRHGRVVAVSGAETIDARSEVVRQIAETACGVHGQPGLVVAEDRDLHERPQKSEPEHIEESDETTSCSEGVGGSTYNVEQLDPHDTIEQTGCLTLRGVAILSLPNSMPDASLKREHDWPWRLVIEDANPRECEAFELDQWKLLCSQLAIELQKLDARNRSWWSRGITTPWGGSRSLVRRALTPVGILLTLGIAALLPVPLVVTAEGNLNPDETRNIYAPRDATVFRLLVDHGEEVAVGQPLIELHDTELDRRERQLTGQITVLDEQAAELQMAIVEYDISEMDLAKKARGELSINQQQRQALASELEIIQSQQAELVLTSNLEGVVDAWEMSEKLTDRPVQRGQLLMRLIASTSDWHVEARIPQSRLDHVIESSTEDSVTANIVMVAYPDQPLDGNVRGLGPVRPSKDSDMPFALAILDVDRKSLPLMQSGAPVTVAIDCGRVPLGYVVCQDLIRMVQSTVRLYW